MYNIFNNNTMQNNNNNNRTIANRSTPVSKERLPLFQKASEIYAIQTQLPLHRTNAVSFPSPVEYATQKNTNNLAFVEKQHPYTKQVLKRKYEEFLTDQETSPLSDDEESSRQRGFIAYQQYKIQRKTARIAELRNRLRAVGLTNLQLANEVTVTKVDIAALRGANRALCSHNVELQQELKSALASKHQMWAELANVSAEDYYDHRASDDEMENDTEPLVTPTLEDLFCTETTPFAVTKAVVPNAPTRTHDLIQQEAELTPMQANPNPNNNNNNNQ